MPELCGSTSDSIAWTAIAASTALPPRRKHGHPGLDRERIGGGDEDLALRRTFARLHARAGGEREQGERPEQTQDRLHLAASSHASPCRPRFPSGLARAAQSAKKPVPGVKRRRRRRDDAHRARTFSESRRHVLRPRRRERRRAVPLGQAAGQVALELVARDGREGGPARRGAEGDRAQSRRPGDAGFREPARMADLRPCRSWRPAASPCRPTPPTPSATTSTSSTTAAPAR